MGRSGSAARRSRARNPTPRQRLECVGFLILLTGSETFPRAIYPGFIASMSISVKDHIAFSTQFACIRAYSIRYDKTMMRYEKHDEPAITEIYAGACLCSNAGLVGIIGLGVFILISLASIGIGGDWE
jgi:hypothetical protein